MDERDNILVETVKKSALVAQERLDYKKLEAKRFCFVLCHIEDQGEDIVFTYDLNGLKQSQLIEGEDSIFQYQFLINLSNLIEVVKLFKVEIIPENVYYDENFLPYIKFRDLYVPEEEFNEEDFLFYYKCFIGGILHEKYSIKDIIDCGLEVLSKNKYLDMICKCGTCGEMIEKLREKKLSIESYRKQNEIRINKLSYVRRNAISILSIVILLGAVIYTGYHTFFTKPKMEVVIAANQAYINKDYVGTIDALKSLEADILDTNTKYILAVAYSQGETFKKEEIQNILAKLTSGSDERILEYWIDIGRLDMSPHGLVAGTTGSGKSEIIQSYILSLAINFHPYEVGFLLIDYKGGGMAGLFNQLPHLLGTITNLDGSESTRAMVSIKSELARRQRIFGENNVNHINGYNRLFKLGKVTEPLPHLFLISDEFAELKKEQPEFMAELVSAARIGRSLGIHLILATQKPSGVVDDQIWTNSKFKLCLKVQNEADSKEMLKTPDAANITQAGRAYLQVGNNEIYELFQSAWSGAVYVDEEKQEEVDDRVYLVNDLGQGEVINQDLSGGVQSNQVRATQLDAVVDHIHEIFKAEGLKMVKRPWLPPLKRKIKSPYIGKVQDSALFTLQDLTVAVGLADIPEEQRQIEYLYDFMKQGNLIYIASSGYGKSVFLGNIILGLAVKNSATNLNMYIFDLGNSALVPYRMLPQTADYLTVDDTDKLEKFIAFIHQEIKGRKQKFADHMAQNFEVYNQGSREKLKAIMIVVDNFDVVKELGYDMEGFFQRISRDGSSLGIFLVITATRTNAVKYATMNNFKVKIAGYNFEETEVRTIVGRSEYTLPEIKGRAMIKLENANMIQIYSPVEFNNDMEYSAHVRKLVSEIAEKSTEAKAKGIPILPDVLRYEALPDYPGYVKDGRLVPIGIDVKDLEVQYIDLNEPLQLIIGGSQTGKTNALRNVIHHIKGQRLYLIDSKTMELSPYSMEENIAYSGESDTLEANIHELAGLVKERRASYQLAKEKDPMLLPKVYYQSLPPVYVMIDVVQDFIERLEKIEDASLEDILMSALDAGIHMVVSSQAKLKAKGTFQTAVKENKCGLVLGDFKEQSVFSYSGVRETNHFAEIGYIHQKGKNIKIKMPKSID